MAIVQGVATLAQEWGRVEELREARLQEEQRLAHDRRMLRARLGTFEKALAAQVALEQARAAGFCAAMAAITPTQDAETAGRVLDMARDLLDRPMALPVMNAEGRC